MEKTKLVRQEYFKNVNLEIAYDSLTGVYARDVISKYMDHLIKKGVPFTFCVSDIDNFKYVNDTYGHMVGDIVLMKFAKAIKDSIGTKGVVGRYGGDEFMIVIENVIDYDGVWNVLHDLNLSIPQVNFEEIGDLNLTLTTGISRYPTDGEDYEELFSTADKALYRGKTKGRNCFIIYLPEKHANIRLKSSNEQQLNAIDIHAQLFDFLSKKEDIARGIQNLFKYLSSNLMLDHICLETKDEMYFSTIHKLSKIDEYHHLDYDLFTSKCSSIGLYHLSNRKTMLNVQCYDLKESLEEQEIVSIIYCKIIAYGKEYGCIRASSGSVRMWQANDIDIILTAARTLGIILHYQNKEIKDLE